MKILHPTLTQLKALGYGPGDRVYVRALLPKNIPLAEALKQGMAWQTPEGKLAPIPIDGYLTLAENGTTFTRLKRLQDSDKWVEKHTYQDGCGYLGHLNQQGYGIYFVANAGGREDSQITRCPALFYECDGVSKTDQWQKVEELRSLSFEPSLVIQTRSSLHVYFVTEEQSTEGWQQLQCRLIQRQGSDPAIRNLGRLMRLAGFNHQAWDKEANRLKQPVPVTLEVCSGAIYSHQHFETLLPEYDSERWESKASSERVETEPTDNAWDIRNFAQYLEGSGARRRGWDTFRCPAHCGQADDSLHIEQSTGAFKCWAGCDPKQVYHAALELAKTQGHELPKANGNGKGHNWLHGLKQRLKKCRQTPWGFSRNGEVKTEPAPPTPPPAIEYQPGERLTTWADAIQRGYTHIVDSSAVGLGKSFDSGMATPELFKAKRVIYLSDQHRNPATPTLKSWPDLEARHKGITKETRPNGDTRYRRVKNGEPYVIKPNCGRVDTVNALRSKNIEDADSGKLICQTCPFLEGCRGTGENGSWGPYNYLSGRIRVLGHRRFLAHPVSLPDPDTLQREDKQPDKKGQQEEQFDYAKTVLLWEEAGENFNAIHTLSVSEPDVTRAIADLAIKAPEQFDLLRPVMSELRRVLAGEIKEPNKFGWSSSQVRALLPKVPDFDRAVVDQVLAPNLDFLNTTKDYGVDLEDLPAHLRKKFSERDTQTAEQAHGEVAKQWVLEFLDTLAGDRGALQIRNGSLTITLPDYRMQKVAKAAKANVYLDATLTREQLALKLGVEPDAILVVQQAVPDYENLEIVQVATMGRLGMSRGADQHRRTEAVVTHLSQADPKAKVIDFKRFTEDGDGKGKWWLDSRGSNDFESISTLILVGTPCRNLADLEAEFTVLHGRSPKEGTETVRYPIQVTNSLPDGVEPYFEMTASTDKQFRDFVRSKVLADIHQAIGRLRSHRRPGEQLKVYFLADYPLDSPVTLKQASELTPEAAGKVERTVLAIKGAVEQLRATGEKVTQQAIAKIVGVTQGYISQFRELLQTLLGVSYSKSNNFQESDSDPPLSESEVTIGAEMLTIAANLPPPEMAIELKTVCNGLTPPQFRQVWHSTPAAVQIKILTPLFFTLPAWQLQQLFEVVGGAA